MKHCLLAVGMGILLFAGAVVAQGQFTGDLLGSHDLSPYGKSDIKGQMAAPCLYCHAPHSGIGGNTPLWDQKLTTQIYTGLYSSSTLQNTPMQPVAGEDSLLCLSCHDGTVAPGQTVPYGNLQMQGQMNAATVFGTSLQGSHPFSLKVPLQDASNLLPALVGSQTTGDPAVQLINGNVECTSCHNPHIQNLDSISLNFLVKDNSNGKICLVCHYTAARTVNANTNPLAQWDASIHATAQNKVLPSANFGAYTTVAQFACLSCHMPHNANGPSELLRTPVPMPTTSTGSTMDAATANCMNCHNGSNLDPAIANVYAEFSKGGHPFPAGTNTHAANEPVVLNNNRHATCVDCHSSHSSFPTTTFTAPPAIRPSQTGVTGVSSDSTTIMNPAVNQYENCFRCHGTSLGKQAVAGAYLPLRAVAPADPLNIIPQFNSSLGSVHPVTSDGGSYPQPSLRPWILNEDGITNSSRQLSSGTGARIFCTDCHNSDDNREFGGTGPNGPHGSQYSHILERRYEFSQVAAGAGAGTLIQNLYPNPVLSPSGGGPYSLCAKCHDLNAVASASSWVGHTDHVVTVGVSCSACHTAHGMGATSTTISGERLVDFDINVVAPNGSNPISFTRNPTPTCTLTCHGVNHSSSHY